MSAEIGSTSANNDALEEQRRLAAEQAAENNSAETTSTKISSENQKTASPQKTLPNASTQLPGTSSENSVSSESTALSLFNHSSPRDLLGADYQEGNDKANSEALLNKLEENIEANGRTLMQKAGKLNDNNFFAAFPQAQLAHINPAVTIQNSANETQNHYEKEEQKLNETIRTKLLETEDKARKLSAEGKHKEAVALLTDHLQFGGIKPLRIIENEPQADTASSQKELSKEEIHKQRTALKEKVEQSRLSLNQSTEYIKTQEKKLQDPKSDAEAWLGTKDNILRAESLKNSFFRETLENHGNLEKVTAAINKGNFTEASRLLQEKQSNLSETVVENLDPQLKAELATFSSFKPTGLSREKESTETRLNNGLFESSETYQEKIDSLETRLERNIQSSEDSLKLNQAKALLNRNDYFGAMKVLNGENYSKRSEMRLDSSQGKEAPDLSSPEKIEEATQLLRNGLSAGLVTRQEEVLQLQKQMDSIQKQITENEETPSSKRSQEIHKLATKQAKAMQAAQAQQQIHKKLTEALISKDHEQLKALLSGKETINIREDFGKDSANKTIDLEQSMTDPEKKIYINALIEKLKLEEGSLLEVSRNLKHEAKQARETLTDALVDNSTGAAKDSLDLAKDHENMSSSLSTAREEAKAALNNEDLNQAKKILETAQKSLSTSKEKYREERGEKLDEYSQSIEKLDRNLAIAESVAKNSKTVAIAATAAAVTVGTGGLAGVGYGILYGTAVGLGTDTAIATVNTTIYNKDASEEYMKVLTQAPENFKTAAISSLSVMAGAGVTSKISQVLAKNFGTGAPLLQAAIAGTAGGATSGFSQTTMDLMTSRAQFELTFKSQFKDELARLSSDEEKQQFKEQQLKTYGLDRDSIIREVRNATIAGGLTGGITGGNNVLKQGSSKLSAFGLEAAEEATDVLITMAETRANGHEWGSEAFYNDLSARLVNRAAASRAGVDTRKVNEPDSSTQRMDFSRAIAEEGKIKFDEAFKQIQEILPPSVRDKLVGRSKSETSVDNKIKRAEDKSGATVGNLDSAREAVTDLIGTRLVLEDTSPETIEALTRSLEGAIEKGELKISEINNYRGEHSKPYFSESQVKRLQKAGAKSGQEIIINTAEGSIKKSGYTTTQMSLIHENGSKGEFQIRGKKINDLGEMEHIPYDIQNGKDITKGDPGKQEVIKGYKDSLLGLNEDQNQKYNSYISRFYAHYRNLESGISSTEPKLPPGIPEELSISNLTLIYTKLHKH